MVLRILSNAILILFIVLTQVSFLSTWPQPISNIHLMLVATIFVAVIINYEQGLWWALFGGILLELYSSLPFSTVTIGLVATVMVVNFLFTNFFTNRSYYALAILGYAAALSFGAVMFGTRLLLVLFGQFEVASLSNFSVLSFFVWQPLLTIVMVSVIYFAFNRSTSRLKHVVFSPENHYEISHRH